MKGEDPERGSGNSRNNIDSKGQEESSEATFSLLVSPSAFYDPRKSRKYKMADNEKFFSKVTIASFKSKTFVIKSSA